jgi:hypothetical protein
LQNKDDRSHSAPSQSHATDSYRSHAPLQAHGRAQGQRAHEDDDLDILAIATPNQGQRREREAWSRQGDDNGFNARGGRQNRGGHARENNNNSNANYNNYNNNRGRGPSNFNNNNYNNANSNYNNANNNNNQNWRTRNDNRGYVFCFMFSDLILILSGDSNQHQYQQQHGMISWIHITVHILTLRS